jgi:hypothetical protein
LGGRFEYIGFCSVVKLAVLPNLQNSVVYPQLPALALFIQEYTAVLIFAVSGDGAGNWYRCRASIPPTK